MPVIFTWQKSAYAKKTNSNTIYNWLNDCCSIHIYHCSYLRWQETGRAESLSIAWQEITLHAISNQPVKCIYLMLDQKCDYPPEANNGHRNGNGEIDDDDEGTYEGMRFMTHWMWPIFDECCCFLFHLCYRRRAWHDRNLVCSTWWNQYWIDIRCNEAVSELASGPRA